VSTIRRLPITAPAAPAFLPYARQCIDEADIAAVADVLRSDYLTTGPAVEAFETAFEAVVDAPHAIACANGTAALHLAMMALNLGPGDAVIVPTITFLATANCARYCGADVVFADVDPDTALMTPATLRDAIARAGAKKIKAILPVHLGGAPCAMAEIAAIAQEIGAVVVEDACHALGTITKHGKVGACTHSAMTVFSLHAVKTIAAGEGGMITTRDAALAKKLKRLRNHGAVREADEFVDADLSCEAGAPAPWAYEMQALGYNYRLNDIQAALGRSQLGKLDAFAARRRAISALYGPALAGLGADYVKIPAATCPHLFITLLDFSRVSRSEVIRRLRAQGIGAQVHYMPVHRQPYYKALYGAADLPGADAYYARCLSLPLFASMSAQDVFRVKDALSEALGQR
jgi:UDP-4-amino-4,6-dideoxy-N-acetyl-beta-L-altrosamine transaminase